MSSPASQVLLLLDFTSAQDAVKELFFSFHYGKLLTLQISKYTSIDRYTLNAEKTETGSQRRQTILVYIFTWSWENQNHSGCLLKGRFSECLFPSPTSTLNSWDGPGIYIF